ncbi:hypothetical protein OGAPHI_005325 [Ogataea philodendri]|uniref:Ureidoglycolate lyase n=1 Tax=Ogataea philodendri TaxID=1378263 RepID=A0A9P8T2V5_9ASCO|nr:uncharacterized protein OGAPHI_005325 [Ogataea philodendri]KAH3663335.1 hypothetical protein OGAPHI_005325 [Ogataea philodendri]
MVVIQTVDNSTVVAKAKPISPQAFAAYGGILACDLQMAGASQSSANQGTAVKLMKMAPVTNNYANAPSGKPATANWNIFRSSPPKHLFGSSNGTKTYTSKVLERHPYTTQTFVPMGCSRDLDAFLVIVAPDKEGLPDYEKVEAFIFKGDQSVTYGVGTWHAPMVVLGDTHLDFAVLVHENGVDLEDCEEVVYSGMTIELN